MPGVFVITWDNCAYGERYCHRQVLITNCQFFASLARDCTGDHENLKIGFGKDLQTANVSAYAPGFCREYAKALVEFVKAPNDDKCVHCLPQGAAPHIQGREQLRRCAEVIGLAQGVDAFRVGMKIQNGETWLTATDSEANEAVRRVNTTSHLEARCDSIPFETKHRQPNLHW